MDIERLVEQPAPRAVTLVWSGEMDARQWPELRNHIVDSPGPDTELVVLDLAAVTFFDSSTIRAVISARRELGEHGVTLHIDRASPIVERVLDLTGLADVLGPSGLGPDAAAG